MGYDDKDMKTDISFVRYVVNKFLRRKKHLELIRQDLEQEGFIALMRARESYDSSRGVSLETHVYSEVLYSLMNFERVEYKHFRNKGSYKKYPKGTVIEYNISKEIANETHLWDIPKAIDLEEFLVAESPMEDKDTLSMIFSKASLTPRQREVLDCFLHYASEGVVSKRLGISRQKVNVHMKEVVRKCRDVVFPTIYQG